jgi:G3E family GTPase
VLLGARGDRRAGSVADSPFADHFHGYGTWTIEYARPVSRDALDRFAFGVSTDVYRAKGFVYLQEDPGRRYVYQQVGRRWSLEPAGEWGETARLTRLVAIGLAGATSAEALQALL